MSRHSLAWVGENLSRDREFSGLDRVGYDGGGKRARSGPSACQSAHGRHPTRAIGRCLGRAAARTTGATGNFVATNLSISKKNYPQGFGA